MNYFKSLPLKRFCSEAITTSLHFSVSYKTLKSGVTEVGEKR